MSYASSNQDEAAPRRRLRLDFSKASPPVADLSIDELAKRLGGVVAGDSSISCPGPGHSPDDRSLHITLASDHPDGFIFYSHAGDDLAECRSHVLDVVGGAKIAASEAPDRPISRKDKFREWQSNWDNAASASAKVSPIKSYLQGRNLELPQGDILRWRISGSMIARIIEFQTGETIGFHETFIGKDGKKRLVRVNGEKVSRLTHVSSKGVIRLSKPRSNRLVIGEGIETVLSARHIPKLRGADLVSLVNAGNYSRVTIPDQYETVYVLADIEPSGRGLDAAEKLVSRLASDGLRAYLVRPIARAGEAKVDLNNVVQRAKFEPGTNYLIERWRPTEASSFLFDGDAPIEPPRMLVDGLVVAEGIAFVGGQSGAGKSFVATDLAAALASGQSFFGHEVREKVGVAILAAEGGGTIARRLFAARKHRNIRDVLPIAWTAHVPNLCDDRERQRVIADLQKVDQRMKEEFGVRLGLIVCDTLGAAFAIKDENDNSEANRIVRAMREFIEALNVVFMPVHHYGKTSDTGLRGASAWRASGETILSVLGDRNQVTGEVGKRSLALAKTREGVEGPISGFSLRVVELGVDGDGKPFTTCVIVPGDVPHEPRQPGKPAKVYLKAIEAALVTKRRSEPNASYEGIDRECVRDEFYRLWTATGRTEAQKSNSRRQQFHRGEKEARDRGLIEIQEINGRTLVSVT